MNCQRVVRRAKTVFASVFRFAMVGMASAVSLSAFADGKIFVWRNETVDIFQPSQKAIIDWDGAKEVLTVQTKYEGPAEDLVWVVPVPSKPEVRKGDLADFEELSRQTQEFHPRHTQFGGAMRAAKASALESPLVSRDKIGAYDVAILSPTDSASVVQWLRTNEYGVGAAAEKILADYVSKKWWIVASRIHRDALSALVTERLAKGTIHPLAIEFATKRCVYPMRLTALVGGPVEILLWIRSGHHVQPAMLTGQGWDLGLFGGPYAPELNWQDNLWTQAGKKPERRFGDRQCITKARRTFEPKEMTDDIYFDPADYVSFFDAKDPVRVGMAATQLGLWMEPKGIPVLTEYLQKAPIENNPNTRSALWALGEIVRGGKPDSAAEEAVARFGDAGADPDLQQEACFALEKMHSPKVGPMLFRKMQKMPQESTPDARRQAYREALDLENFALWFDIHSGDDIRGQYIDLLAERIEQLTKRVAAVALPQRPANWPAAAPLPASESWYRLKGDFGDWLLNRSTQVQDKTLLAPLKRLREAALEKKDAMVDRSTFADYIVTMLIAEAACSSEEARAELIKRVCSEEASLLEKSESKGNLATLIEEDPRDRQNSLINRILVNRTRPYSSDNVSGEQRSLAAELVRTQMPDAPRSEMARRILQLEKIGPWFELYLLGWIRHPLASDRERLQAIWQSNGGTDEERGMRRVLASAVAEAWVDPKEVVWMLEHTTDASVRHRLVDALLHLDATQEWPSIEKGIRTAWNVKIETKGPFIDVYEPNAPANGVGLSNRLLLMDFSNFVARNLSKPEFAMDYQKLCGDTTLNPATRYFLIKTAAYHAEWAAQAADALFNELNKPDLAREKYQNLVELLGQAKCSATLEHEWETATEDWKRDAVTRTLLMWGTGAKRVKTPVLERMINEFWYNRFKARDPKADDFSWAPKNLILFDSALVRNGDFLTTFFKDTHFEADYRAYIAGCLGPGGAPAQFLPDMKALMGQDLSEPVRKRLASQIASAEAQAKMIEESKARSPKSDTK